jgi:hypothetical protein
MAPKGLEGAPCRQSSGQAPGHWRVELVRLHLSTPNSRSNSPRTLYSVLLRPGADAKNCTHSNVKHIEEIRNAGLEMPAVNQIEVGETHPTRTPIAAHATV